MRHRLTLIAALLAIVTPHTALACRPFGSYDFVEDPQGNVWFTEQDGNAVSRLARDGSVTAYPIPTPNAEPTSLALDADGNLWFSQTRAGKLGRVALDGNVSEYALPFDGAQPYAVLAQAGDIWFTTGPLRRTVVRMDTENKFIEMPSPHGWPSSITAADDGALWVTLLQPGETMAQAQGYLARLDRAGKWTIVAQRGLGSCPNNARISGDGSLWFSDRCRGTIERRDSQGRTARFPYPEGTVQKAALDHDGNFWFVDSTRRNLIGRMSPGGRLQTWPLPGNNGGPFAVAALRNGDVIFSEMYNYNINRLTRGGVFEEYLVSVDHRERVRTAGKGEVCRLEYAAAIADKMALEQKRLKTLKTVGFKAAPGQELIRGRCLMCHDATRILRARKSDWSYTIELMQAHMAMHGLPPLTYEERRTVIGYLNRYYNTTN
jgi:streptogramin lyase